MKIHYIASLCLALWACTTKAQQLEKLGEFSITNGYANDLATSGNTCYLATSKGIEILNIANPANIKSLGKGTFDFVDETGLSIAVRDNQYVYLGSNYALHLFDVSDNANPFSAKRNTLNGEIQNIVSFEDRIYITRTNFGFSIVDISDPLSSPIVTGRYTGGSNPWLKGLHIEGTKAYTTKYIENTLLQLDVSDAANVALMRSFTIPKQGQSNTPKLHNVFVAGEYAFLANGQNGLVVADLSADDIDVASSIFSKSQDYGIVDVFTKGTYAYAADAESGIRIVDISDPASPLLSATVLIPEGASRVKVVGDKLFCLNNSANNSKLIIYTITNETSGLNEPTIAKTLTVYPNPAGNLITIQDEDIKDIALYDMAGRKIPVQYQGTQSLDISNVEEGIYLLKAMKTAGTVVYSSKITINHH